MNCEDLHDNKIKNECTYSIQDSSESCSTTYLCSNTDLKKTQGLDYVYTIGSKNKTNYNFVSPTDLNKISSNVSGKDSLNLPKDNTNELTINECMCYGDDISKICSISANYKNCRYKNPDKNVKFDAANNIKDLDALTNAREIPVTVSSSKFEQTNIVECLWDLDDYLEKMDEDSFKDTISGLNKSTSTTAKGILSSTRKKNSFKSYSQFERNSILRKTTGYTFHKRNMEPNHGAISIYGTLNKPTVNYSYHQQANGTTKLANTFGTYLDIDKEYPQFSNNKSESSQNVNMPRFELQNEYENMNVHQVLTNNGILQNLIEQHQNMENDRPRQFGRRAERFATTQNFGLINSDYRTPSSAAASTIIPEFRYHNETLCAVSGGITTRTSSNIIRDSIESSTDSTDPLAISEITDEQNIFTNEENNQQSSESMDPNYMDSYVKPGFNTNWPNAYSRTFALISCTLGLFNISRFATLTINYGGNFLIQFLIISIIFGIPFLWLQMSLGAKLKAGPISMWKISPICVGIGISITFVQYFITIYSSVAVLWLIIIIQDIFIYKSLYPWAESMAFKVNQQSFYIYTNITESIPDYFNVNVLQRLKRSDEEGIRLHMNDRLAFYMVLLWTVVFLILCRGLKSFGKVILLLGTLPILFLAVITAKLLFVVDFKHFQNVFRSSDLDDFLINSKTWAAAAQEAFLTWGLLGASIIAISSRTHKKSSKLALRKDALLVVVVTVIGLCLSALVGICSIQIINDSGYIYIPGSYESPTHYSAIYSLKAFTRSDIISYPTKYVPHFSTLIGEVYRRHTDVTNVSGYQVLRYITELLLPAVTISNEKISWIWTLIIFISFLLFALSQLCVMWKPFSTALGNSSSAVLMSCVTGLLLSMPFATEMGITLVYYMDNLLGGAWFIPVLWSAEIFGVFLIRGRPYNGDDLVNDLNMPRSLSAFLALSWNIFLPIGLIILAVVEYKISMSNQLYYWRGKSYFNCWSRKAGALTQTGLLILVPISAIVQIYRYLTSGSADILDRVQMLYRPSDEVESNQTNNRTSTNNQITANEGFQADSPPKYTPPPSYTTATGARLAKILRQSFRRSIRRILGESETPVQIPSTQQGTQSEQSSHSTVLPAEETSISISESIELENRPPLNLLYSRSLSLDRKKILNKQRFKETNERLIPVRPHNCELNSHGRSSYKFNNRTYTAQNVITVLRSSTLGRRRISRSVGHLQTEHTFSSIENLMENAEPLNRIDESITSAI